jgi:hypothetical protein
MYHCYLVIDVANLLFKLYVAFAGKSFVFVYREVNAISCVENGAPILKRKSGEEFSILLFGDHERFMMTTPVLPLSKKNAIVGLGRVKLPHV